MEIFASRGTRTAVVGLLSIVVLAGTTLPSAVRASGQLDEVDASAPLEASLPDLYGRERTLEEFRGKVVLVNFWASWCTPCVTEMPSIQRLAATLGGEPFAVIGVNVSESELRVRTMAQRLGLDFPILLDGEGETFKSWGATVLPTTYVLDRDGVPRYLGQGPLAWDEAPPRQLIDDLLRPGSAERPPAQTNRP
jgi:thiol-disulfide isomerase/thioredoxin